MKNASTLLAALQYISGWLYSGHSKTSLVSSILPPLKYKKQSYYFTKPYINDNN